MLIVQIKCVDIRDKHVDISDQQLRLPSRVSGPPPAPNNFSTNVFLAWKSNHFLGGNHISWGKKY